MSEILFTPSTELSFDTVQSDSKRLLSLVCDSEIATVRFDLSKVTECDSAGLALLIEAKKLCKQYHKGLVIEGMPKAISALAAFCGVDAMLS